MIFILVLFLFDSPIMLRKFDSGVKVIQSKSQSDEEVIASSVSKSWCLVYLVLIRPEIELSIIFVPYYFSFFLSICTFFIYGDVV